MTYQTTGCEVPTMGYPGLCSHAADCEALPIFRNWKSESSLLGSDSMKFN